MNDAEIEARNQIRKMQVIELDELLGGLAKFKSHRDLDRNMRNIIEEVQIAAMEQKRKATEGYIDAWRDIRELIKRNAKHRKGFRLAEVEGPFILDQAQAELNELKDDPDDPQELADLLGCIMHYAQKKKWAWVWIERLLVEKLKIRFDSGKENATST